MLVYLLLTVAVFGALAKVVAQYGLGILATYAELLTEFYMSLVVLWALLSRFQRDQQFWHDAWAGTRLIDVQPDLARRRQ